jgi:peptidyl-prolyl cis-trans isomerase A (cyclophilin A)
VRLRPRGAQSSTAQPAPRRSRPLELPPKSLQTLRSRFLGSFIRLHFPRDIPAIRKEFMSRAPGLYATFDTTEGTIVCRLFEKDAPKTVANFVELAEGKREWTHPNTRKKTTDRLYDGTVFHRVIPNFMIQGGDPQGTGMGGPGYKFEDETKGSPHNFDVPGKLAMANAGPNTNGSQFFITVAPTGWLTGKHTIFGEVVDGQVTVDKITSAPRDAQDRPRKEIKLNAVKIEKI